jgi:hypothetical protein
MIPSCNENKMDLLLSTIKMLTCTGFSIQGSNSEDSASQAASVVSEVSDEAAPILGRRAEREQGSHRGSDTSATLSRLTDSHSERSDNSDSDWELQQVCSDYSRSCTRITVLPQLNILICGFILKLQLELNSVHEILQFAALI